MADAGTDAIAARHGAKSQTLIDRIGCAIRDGRFAPGQRLIEAEITSEFGVSRGPVREAFRQLSADGLVEIVPNKGAMVRRLSRREALELFEIRTELEALAARRAANAMSDSCLCSAFECATAPIWRNEPRYSTADYTCENRTFHSAIYEAAGSRQLFRLNEQLQLSLIMAQLNPVLTSHVIASSLDEHRAIARAILDGNPGAAERAIRKHLKRATEVVRAAPNALFSKDR